MTVNFPFKVDSDRGNATFDNMSRTLVVNLPTFKSSQNLISVPLANNSLNYKIQNLDISATDNDMQTKTLDNHNNNAKLADSSDSDNNKSNNKKTTLPLQNINKMKKETPEIDNVFEEGSIETTEVFTSNMDKKSVTLQSSPKKDKKLLDNTPSNNNYWSDNCENNNLNKNVIIA